MIKPIDRSRHQFIPAGDSPRYAVIPYADYMDAFGEDVYIPHEVVEIQVEKDVTLRSAWRRYLKVSQAEMAARMGLSQSTVSEQESSDYPHAKTLEAWAEALGVEVAQLED